MPYITSIERMAREEGRVQGRVQGREEGRVQGREEGRAEERRAVLIKILENRFGRLNETYRTQIEHLELGRLEGWLDQAFSAADLETFFIQK